MGKGMVLAYVGPRFCNQGHNVSTGKRPMKGEFLLRSRQEKSRKEKRLTPTKNRKTFWNY